jgi:sortase, srtB family
LATGGHFAFRKGNSMKKKICMILIAVFVAVLGTSTFFIIDHYKESNKQAALYGELADFVNAAAQTDAATEPAEQIPYSEEKMLLPELAELYQQNGDLVGWVSIADTNINYPVMQSVNEPNFYLKHGFDKEYSDYGCPYVQEDCDVQEPSDNLVIYGHHMSNGSMFAHLEKFKNKDFWSEHRIITFNTLTDKQEYEIVAVFRTVVYTDSPDTFKYYRFVDAGNANEFDSFIAKCKELSFYDTGVTAEYGDKLITLSTCEYSRNNSRLVVLAKRITEDGGADAAKTHAEATAEGERPN